MRSLVDRCGTLAFGLGLLLLGTHCGSRTPLKLDQQPSDRSGGEPAQRKLDKLDILLAVDDSISMADKQRLLEAAVPDLIGRLANPLCVDSERRAYPKLTPAAQLACPSGPMGQDLEREFLPVLDVHVGLVTASLGRARPGESRDDRAHLLGSLRAGLPGMTPQGFLAWGPSKPQATFETEVRQMMLAVGETGNGYEAPLEAWLRFLVDPAPYAALTVAACDPGPDAAECVSKSGVDSQLLEQRRAFLRPDSVVVIIVLSDEDDCSAAIEPRTHELLHRTTVDRQPRGAARGSSLCDSDPEHECCYPCDQLPPAGCALDPMCADPFLPLSEDHLNLRCFEQKRRFGRDVLYPVERYRNALSEPVLCPSRRDLAVTPDCVDRVENPLFLDFVSGQAADRTPEAVFLTFIVGVPWQDLARDPERLMDPNVDELVYKSAEELDADDAWSLLIGSSLEPPQDPLMLQSVVARSGTHPITMEPVVGPEAWPLGNSINGHDRSVPNLDDIQYSCTFPLPELRDCDGRSPCDCSDPISGWSPDNPMCQDPTTGEYSLIQRRGKGYPPQRHVRLARELGQRAVLSSICARNTQDASRSDYAYRPAVSALVGRIAPILKQPE